MGWDGFMKQPICTMDGTNVGLLTGWLHREDITINRLAAIGSRVKQRVEYQ